MTAAKRVVWYVANRDFCETDGHSMIRGHMGDRHPWFSIPVMCLPHLFDRERA